MTPSEQTAPVVEVAPAEFPRYKCHREVQAVKIKKITFRPSSTGPDVLIEPEDASHGSFSVPMEFINRHRPTPGMYYVKHSDGFESVSPASVFESGYEKI